MCTPFPPSQEIKEYCQREGKFLWQYVEENEGPEIWDFLREVWKADEGHVHHRRACQHRRGVLPGGLGVERKAK